MAQAVNMKVPLQVRMAAALAGVQAKDFATGWARGILVWGTVKGTAADPFEFSNFPSGSVKHAAFAAAIAFMQVVER